MKSQISILAVAAMLSSAGIIGLVSTPQTTSAHDYDSHIVRHHFGFPGALAHRYYDLNLTYDFKTYHFGTVVDNFPAGAAVEVLEGPDGRLSVRHEGCILPAQDAPPSSVLLRNAHERSASVRSRPPVWTAWANAG